MEIILGQRLKELRLANRLTQKQVAEKFGLGIVTYLHYEKNQRVPPLELIAEFAQFYDVSLEYLLGVEDLK